MFKKNKMIVFVGCDGVGKTTLIRKLVEEIEDFVEAMNAMADLRAPIDNFFETVQINSDVDFIRRNRLNLLSRICKLCLSVADLTKVEG